MNNFFSASKGLSPKIVSQTNVQSPNRVHTKNLLMTKSVKSGVNRTPKARGGTPSVKAEYEL